MNDLVQWIIGGGLATLFTAWGAMRVERWRAHREEKTDEKQRYDDLWAKLEKLQDDVCVERDEYRRKFTESEQQRLHEGEVCERRVREARRESQGECDQIREQMRALSNLSFSQRLEIDQAKGEISMLKAKLSSNIAIAGGRRSSDPALGDTVTLTVPIVPNPPANV